MEKFTAQEKELMAMDHQESFGKADSNKWLSYVSILTYRYYGLKGCDEDTQWYSMLYDFWRRYMRGAIKQPFSKFDYLKNDKYCEIRETVQAFGLDAEQFWYLLLFIYDYVSEKLSNGNLITDISMTAFAQNLMERIRDSEEEDVEIIIKNKGKNIPISDVGKRSIITMLLEGYRNLYKDVIGYDIQFSKFKDNTNYSLSHCMTRAVHEYEYIFNELEKDGYIKPDRSTGASLNKMLLFSQIMHLYRWTYNDNFLYDDSSLKGVLKTYKNKKLPRTISTTYW